ncbi:hypothetical protein ACER0C_003043 [Sarotherodon galilaeus]
MLPNDRGLCRLASVFSFHGDSLIVRALVWIDEVRFLVYNASGGELFSQFPQFAELTQKPRHVVVVGRLETPSVVGTLTIVIHWVFGAGTPKPGVCVGQPILSVSSVEHSWIVRLHGCGIRKELEYLVHLTLRCSHLAGVMSVRGLFVFSVKGLIVNSIACAEFGLRTRLPTEFLGPS